MPLPKTKRQPARFTRVPLAAAILAVSPGLFAQETSGGSLQLEEIIVTAQKRTENMQDVPISIQSLGNEQLTRLNVKGFQDYVRMLPSVSTNQSTIGAGPGFSLVYMRGIATGGDGQATTSQPSVGMYLDEMPITTVAGNLDVHMYDIARVESLAGPQGTLYGASSQAGTIRIITNRPDSSGFSAGYTLEGNQVDGDDFGEVAEGYVNVPLSSTSAIRLVGWQRHDAGYIDNVHRVRTLSGNRFNADGTVDTSDDLTFDNAKLVKDNFNDVDTYGGRASLRIDLSDDWTVTPTIMGQKQESNGFFGTDLNPWLPGGIDANGNPNAAIPFGNNEVAHFNDEFAKDQWYQAALTVEGKISNFDVVYSGSYLNRNVDSDFDYSDYGYFYDAAYTSGYFHNLHTDNAGNLIPSQDHFTNDDKFTKASHELRISSPQDYWVRVMIGGFVQEQDHYFDQRFKVDGLAASKSPNGLSPRLRFPDTVYLNHMTRTDKDEAIFGQLSFDITDKLTVDLGARYFKPEVTVDGFFGFGLGFWGSSGEKQCNNLTKVPTGQADYQGGPCHNVDKKTKEDDHVGRLNASYKLTDDAMIYLTWSEGYRPGGINRAPAAGTYTSDFLTNLEFGWKTTWFDNRFQANGAVFREDWDDIQISTQGANGITQVANGPTAEVLGTEMQFIWAVVEGLTLSSALAYYDSELQDDYCAGCNSDGSPYAPEGTALPLTGDFKGNLVARYEFPLAGYDAHLQWATSYEGERSTSLNVRSNEQLGGDLPSNSITDLAAGIENESYSVELFVANAFDEDAPLGTSTECAPGVCGPQTYGVPPRPRTFGVRFSQQF